MKAMILAAGLGTRLKPITHTLPKPLVPVLNIPLIRYTLNTLKKSGIREVIINLHHFNQTLKQYLDRQKDMKITYSIEKTLLGTGGGILKARPFFKNERFIVINSDILIDIDLKKVVRFHTQKKALATMVVKRLKPLSSYSLIGLDADKKIVLFKERFIPRSLIKTFFTGIHIMEPQIFDHFPKNRKVFCINDDIYTPLIKKSFPIFGYLHHGNWEDMGSLSSYLGYHKKHLKGKRWDQFKEKLLKLFPGIIFPRTFG